MITNFNSLKVRLKDNSRNDKYNRIAHFNSLKVRLKEFNDQTLSRSTQISIP